jgi:hypothetical protein
MSLTSFLFPLISHSWWCIHFPSLSNVRDPNVRAYLFLDQKSKVPNNWQRIERSSHK